MKKYTFLFCCLAIMMSGCGDDETTNRLFHDGANASGPVLQTASWEAAVQFTAAETAEFSGLRLTQVEYYMGNDAAGTDIFIYGPGVENTPGDLLYTAQVGSSVQAPDWNTHRIATPIDITGQEIWISVRLLHDTDQQSIGCDAGPAVSGGDWLYSSLDTEWRTFRERTGESINWNIRGIVEE